MHDDPCGGAPAFHQEPPQPTNRFRTDPTLRLTLERLLPAEVFADAAPMLDRMGERVLDELMPLAEQAECNPPQHVPYDAWGRRVDTVQVDPAWTRLVQIGQQEGLVALPYEAPYGEHTRVVQAGLVNLYDPASAVADCPLVMTDGAARTLLQHDRQLADRYVPLLTTRRNAWTSGQWMTEKEGGSDVGRSSTVARRLPDGRWSLHGTKWFTSATTGQMALALARPEGAGPGSRGLSLFLLELRKADGSWNGIEVRRLKDKLGTRALPTAEIDLRGAIAVPVGEIGAGVGKLGGLLNIARLWASWGGPAGVGHLLDLARGYAPKREVFGKPLAEQPMHRAWLARICAEYEAMLALNFHTAGLVGAAEHGADPTLSRIMAPLTKLACARQAVWAGSELLESFGGAGYVEDTGLPRVFRNLHVHCIWEGTTSVLAHDVLRALRAPEHGEAWIEDVVQRLRTLALDVTRPLRQRIEAALDTLIPLINAPDERQGRRLAWGMARTCQAALLAEAAEWRLRVKNDASGLAAAELFAADGLVPPRIDGLGAQPCDALALGFAASPVQSEALHA
ncbi:acyl-CoA dehydrogenase family protein [Cupriavidus sp. AU9028]|uniref:acyl-CoA dehydrogenase family protein n=1 Tax=Cupriavidus sp. AU9028 TaxID=2871157 RepID=UPI001C984609|nr:acyl-CoA dehydrogenase family protein [Cupriavidus sp. AU9028]MBY4898584.1 acyl-CoA dehydrogenase family protein [Cupriavidus sp. AU9028]